MRGGGACLADAVIDDPRRQIENELEQLDARMWQVAHARGWQIKLGPLWIRRRIGSQVSAKLYVATNGVLLVAGAVLIFAEGAAADLGIAIVVGAIFAMGSFLGMVWSLTVEKERQSLDLLYGDEIRDQLEKLRAQRNALYTELGNLTDDTP